MYVTTEMVLCFKTLLGWKNHYDLVDIPALDPALNTSDSGEFYQTYHPALRLDVIKATIPPNRTLNSYLDEKVTDGITQLLNNVITERKYGETSKEILANDAILDGYGWSADTIVNNSRFVGFMIKTNFEIGLTMVLKSIGVQFNQAQTDLKIYLFHSSLVDPVEEIVVTTTTPIQWNWIEAELKMAAENTDLVGGVWILGYYQDDITGQAINYTGFDWRLGPCGSCDGSLGQRRQDHWRSLNRFMGITPIYVPQSSYGVKGQMFDVKLAIYDWNSNWGLNLKMSATCDLTTFFCQHKGTFKNALGLTVARMILEEMKFSQQINYIEENLKHMIIRDLEGDKETNAKNLSQKLDEATKALNFDHSKLSAHCLPCNKKTGVKIRVS